MRNESFPICFEELVTVDITEQFFYNRSHAKDYRAAARQYCHAADTKAPQRPHVGLLRLLVFNREWSRKFANFDEVCVSAQALNYDVSALRIKGVSVCEKIRHVATADVILLTHGSDYIMASMATPGTVTRYICHGLV